VLAVAAGRTERIRLGAGIAYAWPRHRVVLAQQALTVAAASAGRFELGIGAGHRRMLEHSFGVSGEAPVGRMLEYGSILRDLLVHGQLRSGNATTASTPRCGSPTGNPSRSSSARSASGCAVPPAVSPTRS
jgi:alkanesulfonate monooxygenase SsuD/methylene tetrahydromethanopterin reductase-like flavin-dependent oxidoreductase (luciferase family)